MHNNLKRFFSDYGIEYFSVLPYSALRENNRAIIERTDFVARSVIIYLLPYYTGECVNISRYAASLDYHIVIREVGEGIISHLSAAFPEARMRSFGDHSPIDERHAALTAGLGILGDNGLIINEKYGTYVFIGDVITDIEPELLGARAVGEILRCESCGRCRAACPTGALRGESHECLSAITQKKGELSDEECELMRKYNTAWGCDICQYVCPHNATVEVTPIAFFHRERIDNLTREVLDKMDKKEFSKRAFAWRGRRTVERNLNVLSKKDN